MPYYPNDLNSGNIERAHRSWLPAIFKKKPPKDPDSPELQTNIANVSKSRFSTANPPSPSLITKFFQTLRRWSAGSPKTTTQKVEQQRSHINFIDKPSHLVDPSHLESTGLISSHLTDSDLFTSIETSANPHVFEEGLNIVQRRQALDRVKKNGMDLAKLTLEEQEDKEIVGAAIRQNPLAFQFARGQGIDIAMQSIRENPPLIYGRISERSRDGTRQDKVTVIPIEVKVKFALLFLSQLPEEIEKDLPIINLLGKDTHDRIAEKHPELLKYLHKDTQRESVEKEGKHFVHARKDIQEELLAEKPEIYLQHADPKVQKNFVLQNFKSLACATDPTQYEVVEECPPLISYAKEEIRKDLAGKQPHLYLQFVDSTLQDEVLASSPHILTKDHPELLPLLDETVQNQFLDKHPELLERTDQRTQKTLAESNPQKYLQYASLAIQEAIIIQDSDLFQLANDRAQRNVAAHWPELLSFAKDDIQEELAKGNPGIYLQHAKDKIQERLVAEQPEKLSEFAGPGIQSRLAFNNPEKFLRYVDPDIQQNVIKEEGPKRLKLASDEAQLSYLTINPGYYKYASPNLLEKDPQIQERGEIYLKVYRNGLELQNTPKQYQEDPVIAAAAVMQNIQAFSFVRGQVAKLRAISSIHHYLKPYKNEKLFAQLDPKIQDALVASYPKLYRNIKKAEEK